MRHTILHTSTKTVGHRLTHGLALAALLVVLPASAAQAQTPPPPADDAFAAHRWHFEAATNAALEAWNYNGSHEELYGISEGLTYGLRPGLVFKAHQRITYVSQRAQDAWLLGLTMGLRKRVYQRGRVSAFLEFDVGISDTAIATPPRGTRFNYLAMGGGGMLVRLRPRVELVASLLLTHVSNASLKGPGRNPDIEAIGPTVGLVIGFP